MTKPIAIALIVIGILLLCFGIASSDSFSSDVSKAFTGHPTDKAMWLTIGGAAALVIGAISLFIGRRNA